MTNEELATLFTAWADAHQAEHSAQFKLDYMKEHNVLHRREEDELEAAYKGARAALEKLRGTA